MSNEYILRQKPDGNMVATLIPKGGIEIPISLLNQQIRMGKNSFTHHGRQVQYARYVETGLVSMIIHVPLLKWPTSLKNTGTNKWAITETAKKRDVYLKDVILVTNQESDRVKNVYIIGENGLIPRLTNIYDDGRICTGGINHNDPQMMSPQELLSQLEGSPGNADLCPTKECSLSLDGDFVVINPTQESAEITKFLKDRWEWK